MTQLTPSQQQFISESWKSRWKGVLQSQNQALNWLFTTNTGGVAGVLAYAASKEGSFCLTLALISFSAGLLCMVGYAACMFYSEERMFHGFKTNLEELYAAKIDWSELIARDNARPSKYKICEVLAWIAAISGGVGIVLFSLVIL